MNEATEIDGGYTWAYDHWSSMGYLRIAEGIFAKTLALDGVVIDMDASGKVLGIEIFGENE